MQKLEKKKEEEKDVYPDRLKTRKAIYAKVKGL
jgi:hypothetical protein